MTTRLVLNNAAEVKWICITTHRTAGNSRTITPHIADTAIVGSILNKHYKGLTQIVLSYCRSLHCILIAGSVVRRNTVKRVLTAKLGFFDGIYRTHTAVGRHTKYGVNIEVWLVCLVWLDSEVVTNSLVNAIKIATLGNVARIEAVAHKDDIYATANLCTMVYNYIAVAILVVVLLYSHRYLVVAVIIKAEDNISATTCKFLSLPIAPSIHTLRDECCNLVWLHRGYRYGHFATTYTRRWGYRYPLRATLYTPRFALRCAKQIALRVLGIEGANMFARYREVFVCTYTLKVAPPCCCLVKRYRALRHL